MLSFLYRLFENFIYFLKCCMPDVPYVRVRESREKRLEEISHCKFWCFSERMKTKKRVLKKTDKLTLLPKKLRYADYIYKEYEKDFGSRNHDEYCIYHNRKQKHLREGVRKLGTYLHDVSENPLELIMYRAIGISLLESNIVLEEVVEPGKSKLGDKKYLEKESDEEKKGRIILRKELFLKHYFEVTNLRDILSEEIQAQKKLTSTLKAWIGVFVSIIITGISMLYSKDIPQLVSLTIISAFTILFGITIIWHIWASIQLNEAKDVMFLCLGVDMDKKVDQTSLQQHPDLPEVHPGGGIK